MRRKFWGSILITMILVIVIIAAAIADETEPPSVTISGVTVTVYENDGSFRFLISSSRERTIKASLFASDDLSVFVPYVISVDIGNGITGIESNAFVGFTKLKTVTIGDNVTSIGDYAFWQDENLSSVTFGSSVSSIGKYAFCSTGLTEVSLPTELSVISEGCFYGCFSLKTVTFPQSLTEIGENAFAGAAFTSVSLPDTLTVIGENAFAETDLQQVQLGNQLEQVKGNPFTNCSSLTEIKVNGTGIRYVVQDKALFDKEKAAVISYPPTASDTRWTAAESVKIIGSHAFYGCKYLKQMVIGKNVTAIEEGAFSDCPVLESVLFADAANITTIGMDAFSRCTSLKSFSLPEHVTVLEKGIFSGCTSLESISLSADLVSIGEKAFDGCISLAEITLPAKLSTIGSSAFKNCSALCDVTFKGEPKNIADGQALFTDGPSLLVVRYDIPDGDWTGYIFLGNEATYVYCTSKTLVENLEKNKTAYHCMGIDPVLSDKSEEATCKEEGYIGAMECSICGMLVSKGTVVPKLQHQAGNATCIPATHTSDGSISKIICALCREEVFESITIRHDRIVDLPDSCKEIGKDAFLATAPQQIVIPGGIILIDEGAFEYTHELVLIVCPMGSVQQVTNALGDREWFTIENTSGLAYIVIMPEAN